MFSGYNLQIAGLKAAPETWNQTRNSWAAYQGSRKDPVRTSGYFYEPNSPKRNVTTI